MNKKEKIEILKNLFVEANEAAIAADPGENEDGGTCNFDTPAFRIKGTQKETIEQAASQAGLRVTDFHWMGNQIWFWLSVESKGQANRRSKMSTAASKILKNFAEKNIIPNFDACQYCQMD